MPLRFPQQRRRRSSGLGGGSARLIIGLIMAAFALGSYYFNTEENPITGEKQRVGSITPEQEVRLGLEAAPQMAQQHGGLSSDRRGRERVKMIGEDLLYALQMSLRQRDRSIPYRFDFHLLADPELVNAFALPGGQVFITKALYDRLDDAQLAGVIGHEIGHVLERHGAERIALQQRNQGLSNAVGVASGDMRMAQMAQMAVQASSMAHGRDQELECDKWAVELMDLAEYDPYAMIEVMKVLKEASGGGGQPEFLSTHPHPESRIEALQEILAEKYPDGVPENFRT